MAAFFCKQLIQRDFLERGHAHRFTEFSQISANERAV
jgi:hypothetical protein